MSENRTESQNSIKPCSISRLAALVGFGLPITLILVCAFIYSKKAPVEPLGRYSQDISRDVLSRIQKVGSSDLQTAPAKSGPPKTGEEVYAMVCSSCHATGVSNSPLFSNAEAWAPRIATGFDALLNSALHGKNLMPAQGGSMFSDYEIARAVVYMTGKAGGHFSDPPESPPPPDAEAAPGSN
jgi:cytochrome c5